MGRYVSAADDREDVLFGTVLVEGDSEKFVLDQ
jgi:hypothetical protein